MSSYSPIHPPVRNVKLVESKHNPFQVLRVLHSVDEVAADYQRLESEDYDDDHGPYEVDGKKEDKVANIQ